MPTPTRHLPPVLHLVDETGGTGPVSMVRGYQWVSHFVFDRLIPTLELVVTMTDENSDIFAAGPADVVEATWWRSNSQGDDAAYCTVNTYDHDPATARRFTVFVPPIKGVAATLVAVHTFARVDDRDDLDGGLCGCDCAAEDDYVPACTCPVEAAPVTWFVQNDPTIWSTHPHGPRLKYRAHPTV